MQKWLISVVVIETRKDLPGLAIDPLASQVRGGAATECNIEWQLYHGYRVCTNHTRVWTNCQPIVVSC